MPQVKRHLLGWFAILFCYLSGEALVAAWQLPLPGALVGLLMLFLLLALWSKLSLPVASAAQPVLRHMSLLFVPAVLGVLSYWDVLAANAVSLLLALVVTSILSLGLAAWLAQHIIRRQV